MAITAAQLTVQVDADTSKAQAGVEQFSGSLTKLGAVAGAVVLGKGILSAGDQLLDMARAAADDAASVAQLEQAVNNAADGGWATYGKAIDDVITSGQKLAFSDDDTRSALAFLEAQTGDTGEAMRRLTSAENLARGAHIDLGSAAKLLGKINDDSVSSLSRLGIQLDKNSSSQDALNAVDAKFKGQAGVFAESDAGKMARFGDSVGELKEALGAGLLPALMAVTGAGLGVVTFAQDIISNFDPAKEIIGVVAAGLGGAMVVALGAMAVALIPPTLAFLGLTAAALPWIALGAAVAIGVVELVRHWDDLTDRFPILERGLDVVKTGFHDMVMVVIAGGSALGQVVSNIVDIFKAGFNVVDTVVNSFGQVFDDVIHGHFGRAKDDAIQGAKDIASAYAGYGESLTHVFDGVATSFEDSIARQSAASTTAGDDFLEMKDKMLDATSSGASGAEVLGQAFQHQLQWINGAVTAVQNYQTSADLAWQSQQNLNGMLSEASAQVSFWQGNLRTANDALDFLNQEQQKNGSLTEDQQAQYDVLTDAVGRYQGGIEDSQGAVVDAAVAQAEFIKLQDDLKTKLDAGTISQADYHQALSDATAATDPATSAAYGLASAQDGVATAVEGVVNKLGNLLIDLGLLPESKRTEFQTPGLDDATNGVNGLQSAIDGVQKSFTVYAEFDYTAVTGGLQAMEGYLPNSPAKVGPMSRLPDWSFLTWTVPAAFDAGVAATEDGGARMLTALNSTISDGAALVGPTLGSLIAASVGSASTELTDSGDLAGKDVIDALVKGVEAGLPEWQNIFELVHGDALTALAQLQSDLEGKIRLAGVAGEDTSELQAKLDAVNQIIQTWAEQTGQDFQATVNALVTPDTDAVTSSWLDLLGNIDDIVSGDFQKGLQDQLTKITNELTVAVATGAPQSVIDALTAQQAAIEAQLTEAGLAYQAAIDAGMTDPDAWAKTQEQLQQQVTDSLSYLDALANGSAITDAQDRMTKAQQELALARATGASQDVIAAINQEFVDAQADFNKAASDTSAAIAAGIASPEAIKAYNEAMGIVTQIPIDQLLATLPDMSDFGVSLIDDLAAGIVDGSTTVDDAMSVLNGMVAASLSDLDDTNDLAVSDIIAQLQTLEEQLTGDLAQAFIDGSDPTAISANLTAVEQLLADLQAQADAAASSIDDVLGKTGMIAGAGAGFGSTGGKTGGGGGSGGGGQGREIGLDPGFYTPPKSGGAGTSYGGSFGGAPVVNVAVYATLDGAAITQNVETRVLSFARAM